MNTSTKPAGAPVKILIAEDSRTQAQQLQHILEQQGYHVFAAVNGQQALAFAQRDKPTLIISDVIMPEMDGYALCRQIKSDVNLSDVPIILVTTLSEPADVIRGLECRADNFILKPYDERYLLSRVQFLLGNRDMGQAEQAGAGMEILFNGRKHFITAGRPQILNLLLSTYDAAIRRNQELTRTQEDLRRLNTALVVANKELEAFSYSVSHDLRTPLRHIDGFVSLLKVSAEGALPEKAGQYLDIIADSAQKMGQLIDDLLAFSRMGRATMASEPVDLEALVKETFEGLEHEAAGRNIIWRRNPLPTVRGDRAMLRQVFVNLLANAIKYTRPRSPAEIEIGARHDTPDEVVIHVRDNGVGFDMTYADRLFGVFQRLHSEEQFEGTGVGLANVRRIISRHGGRTWAESKLEGGSTFYFSLPLSTSGDNGATAKSAQSHEITARAYAGQL